MNCTFKPFITVRGQSNANPVKVGRDHGPRTQEDRAVAPGGVLQSGTQVGPTPREASATGPDGQGTVSRTPEVRFPLPAGPCFLGQNALY